MIKKLLLALLLLPVCVWSQSSRKDDVALRPGTGIPGALVYVCQPGSTGTPCSPQVTIYYDYAHTMPVTQPLSADSNGNVSFYVAGGRYDIQYQSGASFYTQQNVIIPCDPAFCSGGGGGNSAIKPQISDSVQYVSTNGSDSNDGLSEGTAKLTVGAAISALPTTADPSTGTMYSSGHIYVLGGTYNIGTTIAPASPFVDIEGLGPVAPKFICVVNPCVQWHTQNTPSPAGGISNIYFQGSGVNGTVGLDVGDIQHFHLWNIWFTGFTGTGSSAVWMNNSSTTHNFGMEKTDWENVLLSNNTVSLKYQVDAGALSFSFGYGNYRNVQISPDAGQTGVLLVGGASQPASPLLYHSFINWIIENNAASSTPANTWLSLGTYSEMINNAYAIFMENENNQASSSASLAMANNSQLSGSGYIDMFCNGYSGYSESYGTPIVFDVELFRGCSSYTTGLQPLRYSAGLTSSTNGDIGYDTTNKNWHAWGNGVDNFVALFPVASPPTNGHCTDWSVVGSVITLADAGAACGSGGGGTGTLTASGLSLPVNQIVLGNTYPDTKPLGSLGTTTTVLHGNAAGIPSFGSVVSADLNITTTTCTNQFLTAIGAGGVGTCTTDTLASAQHANQGTTTTVLHGNAAGNPAFGSVVLSTDVSGQLPIGNVGSAGLSGTSPVTINAAGAIGCATCNTSNATVSSVATTAPITGGTITTTGTIACATCVTSSGGGAETATAPITISAAGLIACATCTTSAASQTNNAVVIGNGGQTESTISVDNTTTHALFATAGAPAFRALATGDLPTGIPIGNVGSSGLSGTLPISISAAGAISTNPTAHNESTPLTCAAASGSGTTYTCTTSPTFVPADGDVILFQADVASTGAMTLNVNSSSAAPVKKQGGGTAIAANDFLAGQDTLMEFDGTNWQMQGQSGNAAGGSGTVTSVATTSPITGGTFTTSGTIACATCVTSSGGGAISGTAPVAVSAAGVVSITGVAGDILAGATPAFTPTPTLGVASTTTGTLSEANAGNAFLNIWSSAAGTTATNTIAGFTAVPTTGDLVDCTSASTTCTLTDAGFTAASVCRGGGSCTSPTFVTPVLGTPTSGTLTNATGLPINGVVSATGAIATIADGNNPLTINCALTSGTTCLTTGETTAATTAGAVEHQITTLTTTTAIPLQITQGAAGPANAAAPNLINISAAAAGGAAGASNAGSVGAGIGLLTGAGSAGGATTGIGGAGGAFTMTEGAGGAAGGTSTNNGGNGGGLAWTTGAGGNGGSGVATAGSGGNLIFTLGAPGTNSATGTAGTVGQFQVTGNAPASTANAAGVNAGTLFLVSSVAGGASSNAAGTAGTGSAVTINSGVGGAGTGTNAVGGAGGNINLTASNGGASLGTGVNSNGGSVVVTPGAAGTGGSGTAGKAGVLSIAGTTAGFDYRTQGTTNTTANTNIPANSIIDQAPTAVTAYTVTRPGAAATGLQVNVNSSGVVTQNFSGSFGAINQTAKTAAITTATLCAATANTACGQAGQYHVHWNFWGSGTACSSVTAGSVTFLLTWTDENAVSHAAVALEMQAQTGAATEAIQATFPFQTALANESASGDFTFSTNGTVIQYATGYTACTTGTGTYNLRATVTQLQ